MLTATATELNPLHCNASAAKRILGIPQSRKVEFVEVHPECAVVRHSFKGQVATQVITAAEFAAEFVRFRREAAKECIATPHKRGSYGEIFKVVGSKGDVYYVEGSDRALACSCEDWHQHETICKHGYAVLALLGLSSLEQYQAARNKVVIFTPEYRRPAARVAGISLE